MSSILKYKIQYNHFFTKGLIQLAQNHYDEAVKYFETAARALNDVAMCRAGENKDATRDWLVDLIHDFKNIQKQAQTERNKEKLKQMLIKSGSLKLDEDKTSTKEQTDNNKFEMQAYPKTRFSDIAGLDDVKEAVKYKAIYPTKYAELYQKFDKRSGGGILLYGLPGTGKTMIAEAIANETDSVFFPVKCSDLGSKWFGETEQNIKQVFEEAKACDRAVIFFDEIEAYASKRRDSSAMERSVPEFLAQMQGVGESQNKHRLLIIGATNKPWSLDGAFLRPGRFDDKIYVPLPDYEARKNMIYYRLKDIPVSEDVSCDELALKTDGFNGADIDYLCEKAKENAIRRIIEGDDTIGSITLADFSTALINIRSSVLKDDKEEMELWIKGA